MVATGHEKARREWARRASMVRTGLPARVPTAFGSSRAFEAFHRPTGAMDLPVANRTYQSLAFRSVPSVSFTNSVPITSDMAAIAIGYHRP